MTEPLLPIPRCRALRPFGNPVPGKSRRRPDRRSGQSDQDRQAHSEALYLEDKTTIIEAQILGQPLQVRGLKAGPAGLVTARSAYLTTQWCGSRDRRAPVGKVGETEA
jgi:hypothetical protein